MPPLTLQGEDLPPPSAPGPITEVPPPPVLDPEQSPASRRTQEELRRALQCSSAPPAPPPVDEDARHWAELAATFQLHQWAATLLGGEAADKSGLSARIATLRDGLAAHRGRLT